VRPRTPTVAPCIGVHVCPARNGKPLAFIRSIVLADKREIEVASGSGAD
jgi:hypothetical protein